MIALEHISKSFPGVRALEDVSLNVEQGQVHALIGENGSGKSTLVKVLAGVYQPDSGWVTVGDERRSGLPSPAAAVALGVRVVHQEAPLVDTLSVAECVALFHRYPKSALGRVRWHQVVDRTRALFERLGIPVDPRSLASGLAPAERAMVSLAIALGGADENARILVLDEATASLPERDASVFLERVSSLAAGGLPVLMVTHRLGEVARADRVTVIRAGKVVYDGSPDVGQESLVATMIGENRGPLRGTDSRGASSTGAVLRLWKAVKRTSRQDNANTAALEVEHVEAGLLRDLSLQVGRGEIVGVAGLRDGGIEDLPLVLAGARQRRAGVIRIAGIELPRRLTPRRAIAAGVALVPSDRLHQGGVGALTVADNIVLPEAERYWHRPNRERGIVSAVVDELDIRPPSGRAAFGSLSGGNQQKVIIGRWLLLRPSLLVLDDPTYGVDPGARRGIFRIIEEAAAEGVGILLFSTEPEQLVDACSRVLVVRDGVVAAELVDDELDLKTLTRLAWA